MSPRQQDWLEILATLPVLGQDSRQTGAPHRVRAKRRGDFPRLGRLWAWLYAGRYDHQIEDGVKALPGSPLALHGARLTAARERNDLACTLRVAVHQAEVGGRFTAHVPVQADAVRLCAEVISAVCNRLEDPFPVSARGMARLRILLSDGRGPLYRTGRGTLGAALRGVLAAL
ncbi:MAG: hypothetical protein JWR34_628 [Mycobacterium sp.]|nr:hypothetical protein [Mycobacterium sp.]